jgi:hypothetical protein
MRRLQTCSVGFSRNGACRPIQSRSAGSMSRRSIAIVPAALLLGWRQLPCL